VVGALSPGDECVRQNCSVDGLPSTAFVRGPSTGTEAIVGGGDTVAAGTAMLGADPGAGADAIAGSTTGAIVAGRTVAPSAGAVAAIAALPTGAAAALGVEMFTTGASTGPNA
jgi:hypothetical protein